MRFVDCVLNYFVCKGLKDFGKFAARIQAYTALEQALLWERERDNIWLVLLPLVRAPLQYCQASDTELSTVSYFLLSLTSHVQSWAILL